MERYSIVYSEVFEILTYMDRKMVMKIPYEIVKFFKDNKDNEYISKVNPNNIFNKDNVSKKTREIIAWLDLEYWTKEEEKFKKIEEYKRNDEEYMEKAKAIYSYNKLFENNKIKKEERTSEIMLVVKKENIITKFLNYIKNILNRK